MTTNTKAPAAWGLGTVLFALLLGACTPPAPGVHELLRISAQGEYTLQGVLIPRAQLPAALAQEQARVPALFAEVVASPQADMAAVTYALDTLKAAQIRFAFIDERTMNSPKRQAAASAPAH